LKYFIKKISLIKTWNALIKSNEVRKLLSISPGTLHNLRITGKIKSKKIGNLHYYKQEEIAKLMDDEA
jgi:Helix-turn-helix domain